MLNRRILRIKAMQALYSYYLAEESLKAVAREDLEKQFTLDPARDDFADSTIFAEKRKMATALYQGQLEKVISTSEANVEPEVSAAVESAITAFRNSLTKEKAAIRKRMLSDIEDTSNLYLKLLQLLVEFAHVEKLEKEKKEKAMVNRETPWKFRLQHNPVIQALAGFQPFSDEISQRNISWSSDYDLIRSWFREIIQKNETILAYQAKDEPTPQEHLDIIIYLMKKVVFKNEIIADYFSSVDLRWEENKPVLSSLVVKTLQSFEPGDTPSFELKSIAKNETDDLDFFVRLFDQSLKDNDQLDEIVANKTRNWDISRVALIDRIILKMALAEMITFPSIPVKVTINEFIEVSKLYSTPKSKQFVNGILDVLANQLTSEGVIKKSGRGLIDNK